MTDQDPVTAMTAVTGQDLDPETADDQGPRIVAAVVATKAAARNCEELYTTKPQLLLRHYYTIEIYTFNKLISIYSSCLEHKS